MDTDEPPGLADAATLIHMLEDRGGRRLGQVRAVQGRALAFGEAGLAGPAVEQAILLLAIATADGQVGPATEAVVLAGRVLAAEMSQGFHGVTSWGGGRLQLVTTPQVTLPRKELSSCLGHQGIAM